MNRLYHGSSALDIELFEPRPARCMGPERDRQTAVYATHDFNFTIPFALPFLPDDSGKLGWSLDFLGSSSRPQIILEMGTLDLTRPRRQPSTG